MAMFPDGWINDMLERHNKTTTLRLQYNHETESLHYETLDGYKQVISSVSFPCSNERWDEMVEMAKKPNRVDLLEDDLFRL